MKKILILSLIALSQTFALHVNAQEDTSNVSFENFVEPEVEETDESVLTYEAELEYLQQEYFLLGRGHVFAQTKWLECDDFITGNYSNFRCTNRRTLAKILKSFMDNNFLTCVNEGLSAVGKPQAVDLHVTHDGIQGDRNHSSRSLHAEARAVDVDSFVVFYENGEEERLSFKSSRNDKFYKGFRSCWGKSVNRQNGCPLIAGRADRTGSIGKEDSNHRNHMHVSVPYCVRGRYAGRYFQR